MSKLQYWFWICWIGVLLTLGAIVALPIVIITLPIILIILFAAIIV